MKVVWIIKKVKFCNRKKNVKQDVLQDFFLFLILSIMPPHYVKLIFKIENMVSKVLYPINKITIIAMKPYSSSFHHTSF